MRVYTIEELKKLAYIRAGGFDDKHLDDIHTTDKANFLDETSKFFDWLEKMEKKGRVEHLLKEKLNK